MKNENSDSVQQFSRIIQSNGGTIIIQDDPDLEDHFFPLSRRRYFVRQISFWNLRMNDTLRLFSILLSLLTFKMSFNSWVKAKFNFDCCLMKWFVLGVIEDQFFSFPWEFIPFIMRINRMERTQYSLFVFLYVKFKAKTDTQLLSKDFSYYIQRRNLQMGGQKVAER